MAERAWHSIEATQVLKELNTDPRHGLTEDEAKRRLEQYGTNELKKEEKASPFTLFLNQFKNILVIILLIAVVLSALVGEVVDAAIIAVIVVFCAVLGFVQEYRAERALEALKKMLTPTITVLRGGKEEEVPSKDLVPGDILLLEAGDKIPADARLVENHSLRCDEASLTGESVPVGKEIKPLPEEVRVNDRRNIVFTGTTVTYGRGKAVVTSTGMLTEFGKIAEEVISVETEKTPLEKRTEEIGKWLGIIALAICFLVAGISVVREFLVGKIDLPFIITMVMFAIALAVAAVPEALAAIVTGALAIGMNQMAKKNALVRKMTAVETLGCTTVICSDKTGTLTRGEMTIRKIFTGGQWIEVTGAGYAPVGEFKGSDPIDVDASGRQSIRMLLLGGLLCNDSVLEEKEGKWLIKGDPTEGALVVAATKAGLHQAELRLENPRIEEIPFSSERKRMTTIHQMADGKRMAFVKGAPETILQRCSHILEEGGIKELKETEKAQVLKANEEMAQAALRVLGFAYRECPDVIECTEEHLERDLTFVGLTGMMDPPREEAIEAIKVCKQVHIKPIMITGDHQLTAVAIAKEMGIYNEGDKVLTGAELEKMPDEEFEKVVSQVTVYARVSPMDKLKIVKAWKKKGEVVAMTGDGVNDAPALKHADIGIAMGITGTEVTKEASDMVLSDDNFATIVSAIERGRWIYDNIKKYLAYLLQCNITEVVVIGGIVVAMGPEFLPLLPAAILYMNLATDGLPALALGVSPPDPDIMKRPPRDPKESVFGWDVKSFILRAVLIECPFFYLLFFHELSDITHARTEIFFLFIIIELVVALNCRSLIYSVFKVPPHKWLLIALAWEIVLIAVLIQIPSVREAFGIMKPSFSDMAIILGFGLVVFAIIEATKVILRKKMTVGRKIPV
ncbi:MAG: cation-translocating P-type ATPase [Thermodesulfobacteriota bacterium]|nr:cation-translocating P-type ATPase [Thermodesulfobacteriota bacterium]